MNDANDYIKDMTARYVYAATRFMPSKQRKDASLELESIIGDMLEERTAGRAAVEKDIDVVLTELGRPSRFFQKEDAEQCLIGAELYPIYCQVLKIVLAAEAGGITIATLVLAFLGQLKGAQILLSYFSTLLTGAFVGWGFLTLFFSLAQRHGGKLKSSLVHQPWNLSNLPTVPENKEKTNRAESIIDIIFTILVLLLFLFFSRYLVVWISVSGSVHSVSVQIFDQTALTRAMPFILASLVLGLGRECFCLTEGRYTRRLAVITAGTNLLSLLCWAAALGLYPIFNADLSKQVIAAFPDLSQIGWLFDGLPGLFFCILFFSHVLDCAVTAFRAWKYGGWD